MVRFVTRLSGVLAFALAIALSAPTGADARQIGRDSATAVLPRVGVSGEMRKRERVARVSARSAPGVRIEAVVSIGCVNLRTGAGKQRNQTFEGTGRVGGKVRRPRGRRLACFASTSVKVSGRRVPAGTKPAPVTLRAALYARR